MQRLAAGGHMELPDFDTLKRLAVAEPERLAALSLEIAALLAPTGLAGAPVFPFSQRMAH